jgi:3'-phosphoadenosine 5'-phosphosulfate (PAPS) 3'-phosphatase
MEKAKTCAIAAAQAAGNIIRTFSATDSTVADKGKDNPVTVADWEANQKIQQILQARSREAQHPVSYGRGA